MGKLEGRRPSRGASPRPPLEQSTVVVVVGGSVERADLSRICARLRALLKATGHRAVVCDVGALTDPDAVAVDLLARLQLTARRLGSHLRIQRACGELRDLLALTGLAEVVELWDRLPLELRGQAEERKQGPGVEEERNPGDLSV